MQKTTRRQFIKQTATAAIATPMILPKLSLAQSANGKLNHASVGVGGMGWSDINSIASHPRGNIAAICDIDQNNLNGAAQKFPNARKYSDWRELIEKEGDRIDSVNVTTPDHMHAPVAMTAINNLGHVDHYHQWVDACLGKGKPGANFDYSGPLTKAVLLATIAVRTKGQELDWDSRNLKFKNSPQANKLIKREYRKGWQVKGL